MSSEHAYLSVFTREAMAKTLALRDEQIERLETENAKLRQERDHWHVEQVHAYGNWEDSYKRSSELESENAKLRELVRDMWFWGYEGHMDSESQEWQMKHIDGVLDRMRELGVGVNNE